MKSLPFPPYFILRLYVAVASTSSANCRKLRSPSSAFHFINSVAFPSFADHIKWSRPLRHNFFSFRGAICMLPIYGMDPVKNVRNSTFILNLYKTLRHSLILRNSRISAFLTERGCRDVIENLKFLNSKYLETFRSSSDGSQLGNFSMVASLSLPLNLRIH